MRQRDGRDHAEHAVEDDQEQGDDHEAGDAGDQALVERLLPSVAETCEREISSSLIGSAPILRIFARSWALGS